MNDTCPACLYRDIPPARTRRRGDQTVAVYRCPCGHTWATSRLSAVYPARPAKEAA